MKLSVAAKTDAGILSDHNEDHYVLCRDIGLYMVADGVGGHQAGEVASRVGCELIQKFVHDALKAAPDPGQHDVALANAIHEANRGVLELGERDEKKRGLGSTLTVLWFHGDRVLFACVGDSRIYLLRNGELSQLSFDEKAGRYRLAASLGHDDTVDPHLGMLYLEPGDRFLLCTDGLHGPVSHSRLVNILTTEISPARACTRLIEKANQKGGPDNITALVADVAEPSPRQAWHFTDVRHDATSFHERIARFRWWFLAALGGVAILALLGWAISLGPRSAGPVTPKLTGHLAVLAREANSRAQSGGRAATLHALEDLIDHAIQRDKQVVPGDLGLHAFAAELYDEAAEAVWTRRYAEATRKLGPLRGTPAETYVQAVLSASHDRIASVHERFVQGDYRGVAKAFADLAAETDNVLDRAHRDLEREKGKLKNDIVALRRRAAEFEPTNPTRHAIERHVAAAEKALARDDLTATEKALEKARAVLEGRVEAK